MTTVAVLHARRLLDRLSFLSTTAAVGSLIWAAVLGSKVFLVLGLLLLAEGFRALVRERRESNAEKVFGLATAPVEPHRGRPIRRHDSADSGSGCTALSGR